MSYQLPSMRDVYKGAYEGTFEEIPLYTQEWIDNHEEAVAELALQDTPAYNDIDVKLVALALHRTAVFQKSKVGDNIQDDFNRTRAMEAMDCFVGKLGTIGVDASDIIKYTS